MFSRIRRNILLKNYTTFKIGGPARYFFIAKTKQDLVKIVLWAKKNNLSFFILGNGSNLLVNDKGYTGIVIKIQFKNFCILKPEYLKNKEKTKIQVFCEAGMLLKDLISECVKIGVSGIEWAAGIPGTIGGAVKGNAGAFGKSMKDIVEQVEVFNVKNEKIKILKNKNCQFNYRNNFFKKNKNLIILSVILELKKGEIKKIKQEIKNYLDYRKKNHPLEFPSAGSVFKNYEHKIINNKLIREFPKIKEFNKKNLIPAGWLIEQCGLKGKKINDVKISEKHANFIVNLGNGKAKDIKKLINLIEKKVRNKFNIKLEKEIQFI